MEILNFVGKKTFSIIFMKITGEKNRIKGGKKGLVFFVIMRVKRKV